MTDQGRWFDALSELALNLRGSWNHSTDRLRRELDPVQWHLTRNPWGVLQTASRVRLELAYADAEFRTQVEDLIKERRAVITCPAWFQKAHSGSTLNCVAYFSMEFMLSEALPIYSGGLGNVAGDQLKAASDLGVPVVGIGLLYAQGYFRQVIDESGAQQALYPYNDPGQLPIVPLRRADGEWLRLEFPPRGLLGVVARVAGECRARCAVSSRGPCIVSDPYVPDPTKFRWLRIAVPGHMGEEGSEVDPTALARIKIPADFVARVNAILTPGATVLVTSQALYSKTTGPIVAVVDADPPTR